MGLIKTIIWAFIIYFAYQVLKLFFAVKKSNEQLHDMMKKNQQFGQNKQKDNEGEFTDYEEIKD